MESVQIAPASRPDHRARHLDHGARSRSESCRIGEGWAITRFDGTHAKIDEACPGHFVGHLIAMRAFVQELLPDPRLGPARALEPAVAPLIKWDTDWNGQISCDELRSKGVKTPIDREHEAYPFVSDGNCDGEIC